MKKTLFVCLAILLSGYFAILLSCSGGSGPPSAEDLDEGTGAPLNLSGSVSGNTTDTELLVKSVIDQANTSFAMSTATITSTSSTTGGSSSSSTDYSIEETPVLEAPSTSKALITKSLGTSSEYYQICSGSGYTQSIDKQIKGSSGTATFTGSIKTTKTAEDQANTNIDVSGTFDNFKYYSSKNAALTGTAKLTGSVTVTKGVKALCDAALSGQPYDIDDYSFAATAYQQTSGSFSVSGDWGAAISFAVATNAIFDPDAKNMGATISGSASIKSGGKTTTCAISGSIDDLEDEDIEEAMKVSCK